ncbi:HSP20-like chaperone [Clavulina sp. PMI_390]|nr:HSP20-like chaperone [Clavulina sp. PMI_390]
MSFFLSNSREPFVTFGDVAQVLDGAILGPNYHRHRSNPLRRVHRGAAEPTSFQPRLDVHEGPNNTIVASFELPGLKKEDVSIEFHNNELIVSGETNFTTTAASPEPAPLSDMVIVDDAKDGEEATSALATAEASPSPSSPKYLIRERRFGKFRRSIALPEGTQPESISASMENGVLTVTYPAATPEQAPTKITVQ